MTNVLIGLKASLTVGFGVAAGQLIDDHAVSLSTIGSVMCVVGSGVWWLSKRFAEQDLDRKALHQSLNELKDIVNSLDCQRCRRPRR